MVTKKLIPKDQSAPRTELELLLDIDSLKHEQAQFALKALLVAGHVGQWAMQKSIELSETIKTETY